MTDYLSALLTGYDGWDPPLQFPERGPADAPLAVGPTPVYVTSATWIVRTDLGVGHRTFVAAGGRIPFGLEGLPREAA